MANKGYWRRFPLVYGCGLLILAVLAVSYGYWVYLANLETGGHWGYFELGVFIAVIYGVVPVTPLSALLTYTT